MKIKFKTSPIGRFKLSYYEGDEAEIDNTLAAELIELDYAESVVENAPSEPVVENAKNTRLNVKKAVDPNINAEGN